MRGHGAVSGALWGGLIGLIFFVPFFGMAIGAATGAAAGAFADYGVNDDFMKELGAALEPGKAAVIFLIRKITVDKVLPEIKIPGNVIQTSLDGDARAAAHRSARGGGRWQRCLRTRLHRNRRPADSAGRLRTSVPTDMRRTCPPR